MGRLIFVNSENSKTNYYYHRVVKFYQNGITCNDLITQLYNLLHTTIILTNTQQMLYNNDEIFTGNRVYCILSDSTIRYLLNLNSLELSPFSDNNRDIYDEDMLISENMEDMPDLVYVPVD